MNPRVKLPITRRSLDEFLLNISSSWRRYLRSFLIRFKNSENESYIRRFYAKMLLEIITILIKNMLAADYQMRKLFPEIKTQKHDRNSAAVLQHCACILIPFLTNWNSITKFWNINGLYLRASLGFFFLSMFPKFQTIVWIECSNWWLLFLNCSLIINLLFKFHQTVKAKLVQRSNLIEKWVTRRPLTLTFKKESTRIWVYPDSGWSKELK